MGSSILSEVDNTSILRTGLSSATTIFSTGYRPLGSCPRAAGWRAATSCNDPEPTCRLTHKLSAVTVGPVASACRGLCSPGRSRRHAAQCGNEPGNGRPARAPRASPCVVHKPSDQNDDRDNDGKREHHPDPDLEIHAHQDVMLREQPDQARMTHHSSRHLVGYCSSP